VCLHEEKAIVSKVLLIIYGEQKIVQLPFKVPTWKEKDLSSSIGKIISRGLERSDLVGEFEKNKEMIVKAFN
jgi:hypothetical protein